MCPEFYFLFLSPFMLFTVRPSCALAETSRVIQVPCIPDLGCLAILPVLYVSSMGCLEKRTSTVRAVYWIFHQFISVLPLSKLNWINTVRTTIYHIIVKNMFRPKSYHPAEHENKKYTGCPRRNVAYFGRVFLMLKYSDITQNTYIQSWTVTEIMATEKSGLLAVPRTAPLQLMRFPYTAHVLESGM
jgi:hypothetical protein